ncbi:gamma-glutamyl-gamma-aminobutyrate hydrolase family protein [Nitrosopumilus sp.]|uniref:gamma-glutamyl-gamma-aminobutyrate hydrolase family protein n=1 Tax=Nitrosopumilus sp. TaxID=2024843 RepID=UPI00260B2B94|nr:gamma-glutamyl-gamma-aminobutyrate hydrolase family protein [Nitrosopumilus sp.]
MKIGISSRIVSAPNYDEKRDAISHEWPKLLEKLGLIPIIIPNVLENVKEFVENAQIDGLILSGGDNIGEFIQRDNTEKNLLEFGIKKEIPIIGVCRGMQIINNYFGGTEIKNNNNDHVNKSHFIKIKQNEFVSLLNKTETKVNSFHNNIITKEHIGNGLQIVALDKNDETIEAFSHSKFPIIGVMWHPEREQNEDNLKIIKTFFENKKFWSN